MSRAGVPIPAAYEGALSCGCAMCGARSGEHCRDEFGRTRRVPCVRRPRADAPSAHTESDARTGGSPSPTAGFVATQTQQAPLDFSEPRRRREEDQ